MDFALRHKDWTLEDWKKVVWSDETKINRVGSDGKKWVWKSQGEKLNDRLVEGTVKFGGGSLMLWVACAGMELEMLAGLMERWMLHSTLAF
jgi:hypothetical protein